MSLFYYQLYPYTSSFTLLLCGTSKNDIVVTGLKGLGKALANLNECGVSLVAEASSMIYISLLSKAEEI